MPTPPTPPAPCVCGHGEASHHLPRRSRSRGRCTVQTGPAADPCACICYLPQVIHVDPAALAESALPGLDLPATPTTGRLRGVGDPT